MLEIKPRLVWFGIFVLVGVGFAVNTFLSDSFKQETLTYKLFILAFLVAWFGIVFFVSRARVWIADGVLSIHQSILGRQTIPVSEIVAISCKRRDAARLYLMFESRTKEQSIGFPTNPFAKKDLKQVVESCKELNSAIMLDASLHEQGIV